MNKLDLIEVLKKKAGLNEIEAKKVVAVGKLEKPKATKKPKAKPVKAKTMKKTPVKKAAPITGVDTVLAIIKRSKKGVGTATLMEKTGYNQKKMSNLVYKLKKQGKIKSVGKGVYVKA
ncbi:MAG: hypothetical protein BMS9Abin03_169 [Thermodesulfobacteriota bacterium]|nr:MAG: hypothetical protein BMS9Abin03_169 [Thermodesulfobacteriota bacterium]